MKRLQLFVVIAVAAFAITTAQAGEVIDRIAATVNGAAILQSDWDDQVRFEALIDGKSLSAVTEADRKASLDRLIDRALIEQNIRTTDFDRASDEVVAARMAEIRKQLPAGGTDATWQAALTMYGLQEGDVAERVRIQIDELRFIEMRFRPNVQLSPGEVEKYYQDEFLPQLRKAGVRDKALTEVQPQIEQLLAEVQVNALLTTWLQGLRSQARIAIRSGPMAAPPTAVTATADATHNREN